MPLRETNSTSAPPASAIEACSACGERKRTPRQCIRVCVSEGCTNQGNCALYHGGVRVRIQGSDSFFLPSSDSDRFRHSGFGFGSAPAPPGSGSDYDRAGLCRSGFGSQAGSVRIGIRTRALRDRHKKPTPQCAQRAGNAGKCATPE